MTIHPAPKPRKPRPPKKRFSSIAKPSFDSMVKRARAPRKPVKKKRRSASEKRAKLLREYGGPEYLAFIKAKPCCACGVVGFSEAAHTRTGGMGRKADAKTLVPLCGRHRGSPFNYADPNAFVEGCHRYLHRTGKVAFVVDLKAIAASCWAEFSGGGET